MPRLGAHQSIAGGVDKAVRRGAAAGCETVQIFVKSPNRWAQRPLPAEETARFQDAVRETGIYPVFAHDSYLVNIASSDSGLWRKSLDSLLEEVEHAEALGLPYLVMHPGSYGDGTLADGMARVARALDTVHQRTRGYKARILLETTAGQGHVIGRRFEELRDLIARTLEPERLGVCFDTCHVFAAGYELRTKEGYRATMQELEHVIGAGRVLAFHLNDSKGELGSHLDRHAHIGAGELGLDGFRWLLNDRRWHDRPMVLETDKSEDLHEDVENLARLRSLLHRDA